MFVQPGRFAWPTFALLLLVVFAASPAWAHNEPGIHDLVRDVRIELAPGRIHLIVSQVVGTRIAARWRKQMDRDHSGSISPEEESLFLRRQSQQARAHFVLWVNGKPTRLTPSRHAMGLISRAVKAQRFGFDLLLEAPLPTKARRCNIRFLDRMKTLHRGHTAIQLVATAGAILVSARLWNQEARQKFRFHFADPALAQVRRELHFTVTLPAQESAPAGPQQSTATKRSTYRIVLLLALLLLSGLLLWQRQRLKYKSEGEHEHAV